LTCRTAAYNDNLEVLVTEMGIDATILLKMVFSNIDVGKSKWLSLYMHFN
jgi:hypothetical protein